jgi:NAD(P)-dependent dehydrogenase (short-subunit alcohol dehydrogenase family)
VAHVPKPRAALVTGANRGVGLAIAAGLAQLGWRVWMGARTADKAAEASAQLRSRGLAGEPLVLDMGVVRRTLEVNTLGPLLLAKLLAPGMAARGWGRIVNVSSEMGAHDWDRPEDIAYRMSKAAMNILTSALAHELKGTGVLANAMHPGWVRTEMGGAGASRSPEEGADTAIWLATLPDDGPTGGFWFDRKPYPW